MPSEYVVRWQGGRIGLGATVFHFKGTNSPTAAQAAVNAIDTFFGAINNVIPTGVTTRGDAEVRVLTESGVLTDVLTVTQPATRSGGGGAAYGSGLGAMIRWNTPSVVAGRRLLGRTYVVPMDSTRFTAGNVTGAAQTILTNAGTALIGSMATNGFPLQVWSRKNGVVADVTSCQVPLRPSTLRTRNDRD